MAAGTYTSKSRVVRDGLLVAFKGETMSMDEAIGRGLVKEGSKPEKPEDPKEQKPSAPAKPEIAKTPDEEEVVKSGGAPSEGDADGGGDGGDAAGKPEDPKEQKPSAPAKPTAAKK